MEKTRLLYRTTKTETQDWFFVKLTAGGRRINFWHDNGAHVYLYTFKQGDKYSRGVVWTEQLCRELVDELRKPQPCVEVVRFAVDGVFYIIPPDSANDKVPQMPGRDATPAVQTKEDMLSQMAALEEQKGAEPAPYILYGKHLGREKEYAWKLTPDKPKRQGIKPGDQVMVWTRNGYRKITVTRIEKAEDAGIDPKGRVKKKVAQEATTPPDEG